MIKAKLCLLFIIASTVVGQAVSPTEGCRSPTDTYNGKSCSKCCFQGSEDCIQQSGTEWYNNLQLLNAGTCPEECAPCASCSKRDEDSLNALTVPEGCNPLKCATMEIGVDPCFAIGSCECFCDRANSLMADCPQVDPPFMKQGDSGLTIKLFKAHVAENTAQAIDVTQEPNWPGCATEKQCLSGDIMPTGPQDPMAAALQCCDVDEECRPSLQMPEMGSSCVKMTAKVGETCEGFNENTGMPFPYCGPGLDCVPAGEASIPGSGSKCQEIDRTVTTAVWTMQGPWDLDTISGESEVAALTRIFSQTLGVPSTATKVFVHRRNGVVEIVFTVTAFAYLLKPLQDPTFRNAFEFQIAHDTHETDLAQEMFITETDVTAFYVLEGIWDESQIQDYTEQLKHLFSGTLMMPEDEIEEEITTANERTQVIYKAKSKNPLQIAPLYNADAFTEQLRQNTLLFPGLNQVLGIAGCPVVEPIGGSCTGEMRCEYGIECCCGHCHPSYVSYCMNGKWASLYTDACMMGNTLCSEDSPFEGLQSTHTEAKPSEDIGTSTDLMALLKVALFGALVGLGFGCVLVICRSKMNAARSENSMYSEYFDIAMESEVARTV